MPPNLGGFGSIWELLQGKDNEQTNFAVKIISRSSQICDVLLNKSWECYHSHFSQVNIFVFESAEDLIQYIAALCPQRRAFISGIHLQIHLHYWSYRKPSVPRHTAIMLRECTGLKALRLFISVPSNGQPHYFDERIMPLAIVQATAWVGPNGVLQILHPQKIEVVDVRVIATRWDMGSLTADCEYHVSNKSDNQPISDYFPQQYGSPDGVVLFHRQDPDSAQLHHLPPFEGLRSDICDLFDQIKIRRDAHPQEATELTEALTATYLDIWGEGRVNGGTRPALISSRTRAQLKADVVDGTVQRSIWSAATSNIWNIKEITDAAIDPASSIFQFEVLQDLPTGPRRS